MPRPPTIIAVAQHAGVSKSTVSRVLQGDGASVSEQTRERVLHSIQTLGYEHNAVASSLRTDRTSMIMLAIPDITNPFWPEVARGLQDTVEQSGYSVVFANSDWDAAAEERFLRMARRNRFDAIAINPTGIQTKQLLDSGLPTVVLGVRDDYPEFDMVGSDSYGGTIEALEHLYGLGHRRIAFIQGQHASGRGQARQQGYADFLERHDLPWREEWIVEVPFDLESGRRAAATLFNLPQPPTAIFAANDILAIGALQSCQQAGLAVPDDISIIGMDDIYSASATWPALTTMAKDKYAIGQQAARFLLERLDSDEAIPPRRQVVPCRLVVRNSTAPPRPDRPS